MIRNSVAQQRSNADSVALTCLAQLEKEEAMLSATLESLRAVRSALLQGDLAQLSLALENQQHTAKAATELCQTRARLRDQMAGILGIDPHQATLRLFAERVSENLAARLANYRQRLSGMAAEVDRLNRGNAALIRQSLDLLQRLLSNLTGLEESADRYSSSGQREQGVCGSIFQTRC